MREFLSVAVNQLILVLGCRHYGRKLLRQIFSPVVIVEIYSFFTECGDLRMENALVATVALFAGGRSR